jgi:hypothetical protein
LGATRIVNAQLTKDRALPEVSRRELRNLSIRFKRQDGAMYLLLLAPQVLIWFAPAFLFGTGGFWISFAETLTAIPGDAA